MQTDAPPQSGTRRALQWVYALITVILWLGTAALGLVEIVLVQRIFTSIYMQFSTEVASLNVYGIVIVLVFGIIWLAYTFGSAEIHLKNIGKGKSWSLFAWAIAIELLILILYYVV